MTLETNTKFTGMIMFSLLNLLIGSAALGTLSKVSQTADETVRMRVELANLSKSLDKYVATHTEQWRLIDARLRDVESKIR